MFTCWQLLGLSAALALPAPPGPSHHPARTLQGLTPHVSIYSTTSLQCLARFTPSDPPRSGEQQQAQQQQQLQQQQSQRSAADGVDGSAQGGGVVVMGVTALAFSGDGERLAVCGDEPDCSVIIYLWRKVGHGDVKETRNKVDPNNTADAWSIHVF